MAKPHTTETAQRAMDAALQLFGGLSVAVENVTDRLYRPLLGYEGAIEIQKSLIGEQVFGK